MLIETPVESNTNDLIVAEAENLLTGRQIRMARAALKWSAHDLAKKTGLSYGAIQKAEAVESKT